jgi:outer membrane protein TolC/preprotein translocase subunit SecF
MVILTGAIGEFIEALPITVAIALSSSFVVAMFLTPLLCYLFIKKGLHNPEEKKKRRTLLDLMQLGYNNSIEWCVRNPKITIIGSLLTIVLAVVVFKEGVRHKFFPEAERNQFVVELWMPTGTKLDKTENAMLKVEELIKNDKRVVNYAAFIGQSAPRFYYNYSPEMPMTNFAQLLVNTTSDKTTIELFKELPAKIEPLVPDGSVEVKLMQQGQPLKAPVEVRIIGSDIGTLKKLSVQVQDIIRNTEGSRFVRNDFREDYMGLTIEPKNEANRLGFTTSNISQMVYAGLNGYPVTTLYDGDNPIDIVLRLGEQYRQSTKNLEDVYIESPVSGAKVPLRQIADLKPEWHPGEIIRRNGIPTLTVQSETTSEVLASELLSEIKPKIEGLELPTGYHIEYGGEQANKSEVFGQMVMVIVISLIAIFLVLMLQFKNIKEVGLVMLTIPLTAFGAISGLYITGNDFGFTAFVGLISLSGIVVRNAIILIDHANELIKQGKDIKTAAIESGKRRLRPIFLTAMAAAIGVWPMILSGSQLWSPLASVIAFGVVWSMVISTLTIPVLYSLCITPKEKGQLLNRDGRKEINKTVPVAMLIAGLLLATTMVKAQTPDKPLSLIEIQEMAIENNRLLKIKQLQVNEKQQKVNEDRVKFFPVVAVNGNYQYNSELPALTIPAGSFGTLPMQYFMPNGTIQNVNVELPNEDKSFEMGQNNTYNGTATIYQPISQLPKISAGVNVSKTELEICRKEQEKATMQVKQTAEKLYYGILIALKQKEEAELKISVAKARLENAERALHAGKITTSATVGLKAALADEEQNLLKITIQLEEYQADLSQLIGWSEPRVFTLQSLTNDELEPVLLTADSLKNEATSANANIKLAELNKKKVDYAIRASNYSYLPDLGVLGGYMYQQGNKLLPENNTFVGVSFKWNIQDMVTTTYSRKQRVSQREQAEQNIAYTIEQVNTDMAKAERRIKQSMALISVARQVVDYRREDFKIQADKQTSGLNIDADYLTAKAALLKAESDLYAALLSYRIALTDMRILTGNY